MTLDDLAEVESILRKRANTHPDMFADVTHIEIEFDSEGVKMLKTNAGFGYAALR
jgi:hypothetical protein